jgi:hypothetical protein
MRFSYVYSVCSRGRWLPLKTKNHRPVFLRLNAKLLQAFIVCVSLAVGSQFEGEPTESLLLIAEIETPVNDRSHLWHWVSSMDISRDGRYLAIFNMKPPRVSILDTRTLELITSFGKKGRGPGEFLESLSWVGLRGDRVYVSQMHRTSIFSMSGEHLDRDMLTLSRTVDAQMLIHQASGVDGAGSVYFWDARRKSEYLIGKKTPDGREVFLISRKQFGVERGFEKGEMMLLFNVLEDGSIILAFSHVPIVTRCSPEGNVVWSLNLVEKVPLVKKNYDNVKTGRYVLPMSIFWADETYTILKFSNEEKRQGKPSIFYVFINSAEGNIRKIAYAAENLIRQAELKDDEIYSHDLYNPTAIAHKDGILFAYSRHSGKLQKYRLLWY